MQKRSLQRGAAGRLFSWLPLACLTTPALAVGFGAGCVNPMSDYEDYTAVAGDAQGPPTSNGIVDSGPIDSANLHAPDSSFSDNRYLMACESQLGLSAAKALLWVATVSFTPKAGGGGTLDFSSTPLAATATDVNSPIGTTVSVSSTPIAHDGTGTIMVGSFVLPKEANGITGAEVDISNAVIDVRVEGDDSACALLGGTITAPLNGYVLIPSDNACIFVKTDGSGGWPALQDSDFHCP